MMDDVSENDINENNYLLLKNGSQMAPDSDGSRREISEFAIWSLSSSKSGNGVEQLRDDNVNTFWQSDGLHPHFIIIQFLKQFRISELWIYLDYKTDESYTPSRISIQIENAFSEMSEVKTIDFEEPCGWFKVSMEERNSKGEVFRPYLKTMMVKINIIQNVHSGRDAHIRCVKIFSPREKENDYDFTSQEFIQSQYIR